MVPLTGETSNDLIEIFEEWEDQLRRENLDGAYDIECSLEEPQP